MTDMDDILDGLGIVEFEIFENSWSADNYEKMLTNNISKLDLIADDLRKYRDEIKSILDDFKEEKELHRRFLNASDIGVEAVSI